MPLIKGGVKLKHGTLTRVARSMKLSLRHVSLVANGERQGSNKLIRKLQRIAEEQAEEADRAA